MDTTQVTENVVSQILTEIDGMEDLRNVSVIAVTNRPDILNSALLCPERFEHHILVPPPDDKERKKIFEVYITNIEELFTKEMPLQIW